MIAFAPSSIAFATATTMPRSLNDPVGLQLSSLKYSASQPRSRTMCVERTSGVSPSPSEIIGVASVIGRCSAKRCSTPRFGASPWARCAVVGRHSSSFFSWLACSAKLLHLPLHLLDLAPLHPLEHLVQLEELVGQRAPVVQRRRVDVVDAAVVRLQPRVDVHREFLLALEPRRAHPRAIPQRAMSDPPAAAARRAGVRRAPPAAAARGTPPAARASPSRAAPPLRARGARARPARRPRGAARGSPARSPSAPARCRFTASRLRPVLLSTVSSRWFSAWYSRCEREISS